MSGLQVRIKFGGDSRVVKDIDVAQVDATIRGQVSLMLQGYAPMIRDRARQRLRERIKHPESSTGDAERSICYRTTTRGITIYMTVLYGGFVEYDTRPHRIYPRNAKALHWTSGESAGGDWLSQAGVLGWRSMLMQNVGVDHFAAYVNHPGTTGKHMIRDAINDYRLAIRNETARILAQSLRESATY